MTMRHHNRRFEEKQTSRAIVSAIAPDPGERVRPVAPTEDDVRTLAYRKWEGAGHPPGDGVEFWLAAERELAAGASND